MAVRRLVRTSSAAIKIRVRGAEAELHGIDPGRVLPECLRFKDPEAKFSESYKRGDWDGLVDLFSGRTFPAGLSQRVIDYLVGRGESVDLVELRNKEAIDFSRMTTTYIVDPTKEGFALRPHQMDGILAMLHNVRGVVQAPTGAGKTEMMAAVARYLWEELSWRTLVVAPKRGIAIQTARRFELYYQGDVPVGLLAEGRREAGPVTVATAQTLLAFKPRLRRGGRGQRAHTQAADPFVREVVKDYEVLMFDECHRTSSDSWYEIAMESGAHRRFGLSATPIIGEDLRDAKLIAATGPVLFEAKSVDLIKAGFAAKPKIVMVMSPNASGPNLPTKLHVIEKHGHVFQKRKTLPYAEAYMQGIVRNEHHNRAVVLATQWLVEHKRQTIVLCRRKEHFLTLGEMLDDAGISFLAVWGTTETSDRDHAKSAFAQRAVQVVLATTIWDEGEDIRSVEGIVLAEGVKVSTNSRQRVGRGMRPDSDEVWVVDFVPTSHPRLMQHAYQRALSYEQEGYEVRVLDRWPGSGELDFGDELFPFLTWDGV